MSNASFETRCICRLMKKGRLLNLVCASIVVVIVVFRFVGVGWGSVVGLFILQKVLSSFFDDFTPLIFSINQWLLDLVRVLVVAKSRKTKATQTLQTRLLINNSRKRAKKGTSS